MSLAEMVAITKEDLEVMLSICDLEEYEYMPFTFSICDFYGDDFVRNYPYSVEGIAQFMKDNRLNFSLKKDALYAGVIVSLLKREVILPSTNDYSKTVSDAEVNSLEPSLLDEAYELSKSVIIAALHAFVKGTEEYQFKWYESFVKAKGDFVTKDELISLCKWIHGGSIQKAMDIITVEDVNSENSVYEDALLLWLPSPSFVMTAIKALPYAPILKCFPKEALVSYIKFKIAGIVAQIASGRLGVYCKGTVNPLKVKDIPKNLRLSDLQKIEAPYDAIVIMKAKVILDAIGYKYGRWYQAENANKKYHFRTNEFQRVVNALKSKSKLSSAEEKNE